MSKTIKATILREEQQALKDANDSSTLMNQISGALVKRLIQRGGSLENLKLILSGVRGTEIVDESLNALARTSCYHLNVPRVFGFEEIKRTCPISGAQPTSSHGRDLTDALAALDATDWHRHLDGMHMRLQCLIVSFENMPMSLKEMRDFGANLRDPLLAPRGYRPGNTVEMFSFHAGAVALLPVLADKCVMALGDMSEDERQPPSKVGNLYYEPIPRRFDLLPVMPEYTKQEMSPAKIYVGSGKRNFFLFVAKH